MLPPLYMSSIKYCKKHDNRKTGSCRAEAAERSIGERGERVKGVGVEQQMGWENGKECDGKKDRQKRTVL